MARTAETCRGLVLRSTDVSDNDKLLTLFTAEHGKITVSAKGARSLKSRYMPVSQQFAYGEYTFSSKNGYKWLSDASLIESFFSLRRDLPRLALACYVASVAEQLALEGQPDDALLRLTLNTFFLLTKDKHALSHIKSVFELSAVSIAGFAPEADYCGNCSSERELNYLATVGGVTLCSKCVTALYGNEIPFSVIPMDRSVLDAVRFVTSSDSGNIFSFKLPEDEERELSVISERYLLAQLDCGFKTLSFYHEVSDQ